MTKINKPYSRERITIQLPRVNGKPCKITISNKCKLLGVGFSEGIILAIRKFFGLGA